MDSWVTVCEINQFELLQPVSQVTMSVTVLIKTKTCVATIFTRHIPILFPTFHWK